MPRQRGQPLAPNPDGKGSAGPLRGVATLADMDLRGKRVLLREDLNVPVRDGEVANSARISAALPTIARCANAGAAAVLVVSHLGRPAAGQRDPALSLAPVAKALADGLGRPVRLVRDWRRDSPVGDGQVALLENIRFEAGELRDDETLARQLASLCDVFVMDAFATAHRAHASTCGVARFAAAACAGPLLEAELTALGRALVNPSRPVVAIIGGAKVSTKLTLLQSLAAAVDVWLIGGGMVNTFLAAAGYATGASAVEADLFDHARRLIAGANLPLPVDVTTATAIDPALPGRVRLAREVAAHELVLDIGPETARRFAAIVQDAGTVLWNGPLGVFELDQFGEGTRVVAEAVASADAFSIAGGGDTLAAIDKYGAGDGISYLSTGGGAFLAFLEGRELPGVQALRR